MADPTPEERRVISEFRENVRDLLDNEEKYSDDFLIRWLRARDMDLIKAEELLRHSLNWREENGIDRVLDRKFDAFFDKNYPYTVDGYDRVGRPVSSVSYQNGCWDFRKIAEAGKEDEFKSYTASIFETIVNKIKEQNVKRKGFGEPTIRQYWLLVDYSGFTYGQLLNFSAMSKLLSFATTYESHYPELLYKCVFVNCPSFIGAVMTLIKPLLASKTFSKIECYGYNKQDWTPLIEEIEEDQLPPQFRDIEITHL